MHMAFVPGVRPAHPSPAMPAHSPAQPKHVGRVVTDGKFFALGGRPWVVRGLTYGPFAPNHRSEHLPDDATLARDLRHVAALGGNCVRVYHPPTVALLDAAVAAGVRVFVDVPWDKHRCFFEDWPARQQALARVSGVAKALGGHPGLLAISVANEFPNDVVRFSGHRRVARFVDELLDAAKQAAPEALVTFANYPTTEFLRPELWDFACFNVYLEDEQKLGSYLDRLQHWAGNKPLVLGEFGADSLRHGEAAQAAMVRRHLDAVRRHGLAGSFVFSFTDDWYTGGHQVEDWAFGVTRVDRAEKPAADVLRQAWADDAPAPVGAGPAVALPRVSVVVCSYNGAKTLRECLTSLRALDYPDYEVILVDDGSTDDTQQIAADFPEVVNVRQPNMGLSVARNVGAERATGEVVAYTDSDCVAHPRWLTYLVEGMLRQGVEAVGGPNIPPPSDAWTARCVAASPGGPSHVMLDDRLAEHVPGCNMAFRRDVLLGLGGFDAQFRQAGDDVDVCWRLLDAGHRIGFAAAAQVWHHRRSTVRAYLKQQKGYGRSEAMLLYKHPGRFNRLGASRWRGVIYGEGAVGLTTLAPVIYHGRGGGAPFQAIYARNEYGLRTYPTLLEWHAITIAVAVLGFAWAPLWALAAAMALTSSVCAASTALTTPLAGNAPWWCRPLVLALHLAQPVVRAWHRYAYRLAAKRLPAVDAADVAVPRLKRAERGGRDAHWPSRTGVGREQFLSAFDAEAVAAGWPVVHADEWADWDRRLSGDRWHSLLLWTATEELGGLKRFTRARFRLAPTAFGRVTAWAAGGALGVSLAARAWPLAAATGAAAAVVLAVTIASRHRCLRAAAMLAARAAAAAGLGEPAPTPAPQLKPVVTTNSQTTYAEPPIATVV